MADWDAVLCGEALPAGLSVSPCLPPPSSVDCSASRTSPFPPSMPAPMSRQDDLDRIREALQAAREAVRPFTPGQVAFERKEERGDPVTEADHAIDRVLRELLPRGDEGWLSEETVDEPSRLERRRVWVVDPLDGTREFVQGIPEWCISVGLVEEGRAVAGGILNPTTGEEVVGSVGAGVELNGQPARVSGRRELEGAVVVASRSELRRGDWDRFEGAPFQIRPCGSVAYKLALVAAGLADATWTMVPKNEWDVAAGVALVKAAGGKVVQFDGTARTFNQPDPLLPNLVAASHSVVTEFLERWIAQGPRAS